MSKVIRMVVCAANFHKPTGSLILGVRHWDKIMRDSVTARQLDQIPPSEWEQGFIDQQGEFLSRKEALIVAEDAGQMIRPKYQPDILFSENIY